MTSWEMVWLQRKLSERSTQPLSPERQTGYAVTWQVIMELAHALPRTRGEPCGIRQLYKQRYCGVMTALPKATCIIPSVWGAWQIGRIISFGTTRKHCSASAMNVNKQMVGTVLPKLDTMRWQSKICQRIHVTLVFTTKYYLDQKEGS